MCQLPLLSQAATRSQTELEAALAAGAAMMPAVATPATATAAARVRPAGRLWAGGLRCLSRYMDTFSSVTEWTLVGHGMDTRDARRLGEGRANCLNLTLRLFTSGRSTMPARRSPPGVAPEMPAQSRSRCTAGPPGRRRAPHGHGPVGAG